MSRISPIGATSAPDDINALVVAHRILGAPSRFRATDAEVLAMAGCLVGLDQQIERLGVAIRAAIGADHLGQALADLQSTFEQEFPHGQG